MSDIHIATSSATPTSTGVSDGLDVDFTLTVRGVEYQGGVTLRPNEDGSAGYSSWGDLEHWLDGGTVNALRSLALSDEDMTATLSEIVYACAEECDIV